MALSLVTGEHPGYHTIVMVEGVTDELALMLAAARSGRDLRADGVAVVPINGAHAISRFLRQLAAEKPHARLAGLYDEGEEEVIRSALERAGYGSNLDRSHLEAVGFFACVADLEEELIRSAVESGIDLSKLVELEGDAQPWRTFRSQSAWRGRPIDQQFRRFIRSVSERNSRYIRAMIEAIDPPRLPRPLLMLLDYVERPSRP
ncbi:MAG TPA: TOPRIM nucleotidyl transferase/hydrolase domain-containing protein [Candidatus Udaeobacter sp.]|nr:TOPRIM nucleotidyl transferase/hydrolase domain-containing protein [Candidatus Udaeobacter sp.]